MSGQPDVIRKEDYERASTSSLYEWCDVRRVVSKQRGVDLRIVASSKTKQSMQLVKSSFPLPTEVLTWICVRSMTSTGTICRGAMATSAEATPPNAEMVAWTMFEYR